jgi:hypothetical protein
MPGGIGHSYRLCADGIYHHKTECMLVSAEPGKRKVWQWVGRAEVEAVNAAFAEMERKCRKHNYEEPR